MTSNNTKYNRFLNNKSQDKNKDKNKLEYKINENDFPDLTINEKNNNYYPYLGNTFANTILIDKIIEEKIMLEPGWISIEYDIKSKTKTFTYGSKTENMIKKEEQIALEDNLNYRVDRMIDKITETRKKHIQYYETMYGDDTYTDLYLYSYKDIIDSDEEYEY